MEKKLDWIALSQFAKHTGIDRRKCHALLMKLVEKKIVKKVVTQKGDKKIVSYGIQKDFELWKVSPKKVTVTQKGTNLSPKKALTKDTIQKKYTDKSKTFVRNFNKYISEKYPRQVPQNKKTWEENSLDTIDKLTRLDGFQEEYIFEVIRWAKKDDFWSSQLYSLAGLRKKNGDRTKFQKIVAAYDKAHPEVKKGKIVFAGVMQ